MLKLCDLMELMTLDFESHSNESNIDLVCLLSGIMYLYDCRRETHLETVTKKVDWPIIRLLIKKNPQFQSNYYETCENNQLMIR